MDEDIEVILNRISNVFVAGEILTQDVDTDEGSVVVMARGWSQYKITVEPVDE